MEYILYRISHITCILKLFYLHVLQSSQSIYIVAEDLNNTDFKMFFALIRMVILINEIVCNEIVYDTNYLDLNI